MNRHMVLQWEVYCQLLWPNLFMEEFEKKALATSKLKPRFWFRHVDDTLSSWAHGLENFHRFLEHINSLHLLSSSH